MASATSLARRWNWFGVCSPPGMQVSAKGHASVEPVEITRYEEQYNSKLPKPLCRAQIAAKAQRASVEPAEIVRYEEYNAKHGARLPGAEDDEMGDAEDGW